MSLVLVDEISQWGSVQVSARDRIGRLLAMLIRSTLPYDPKNRISFLYDGATNLSGWDGQTDALSSTSYVPLGRAVWELGTGNGDKGKIEEDFTKRLSKELPAGWVRQETTYVAVTTAKLQDHAAQLLEKLRSQSQWKSVEIIDAVNLSNWLDTSPTSDIWLYENIRNRAVEGRRTLSYAWAKWIENTSPTMSTALVVVSRDADLDNVVSTLNEDRGLQIDADSPDEAVAFVYEAVNRLPEARRDLFMSRALVISSETAAEMFPNHAPRQLIVVKGDAVKHATRLEREGHQVVRVHGRNTQSRRRGMVLSRQGRADFARALTQMGVAEGKAEVDAKACGASASIWRVWNLFWTSAADGCLPSWAQGDPSIIVAAVLLGGWSERSEHDLKVVAAISGMEYQSFRDELMKINQLGEPLVEIVGDAIVVAAPAAAFAMMAKSIGVAHVQRFQIQIKAVLGEFDPIVDIAPEERMYAGIRNQRLGHSEWLRDGFSGSLLRIAVLGQPLEENHVLGAGVSRQAFVDALFRELPGLIDDHRLVASLRDQLPVLAEAAPIPFLEALETLLRGCRDDLLSLFAEGGDFGGNSFYPAVLWALEALAWDRNLLSRVCNVLGGLDALDPGGRLSNRPVSSLVNILLPWFPGTLATVAEREATMRSLLRTHSETGWKVLMKLMPGGRDSTSGTYRPEWRDSARGVATRADIAALYTSYVDMAIDHAQGRNDKLPYLVAIYPNLISRHRETIEEIIETASRSGDEQSLLQTWESLRELIADHRALSDASWALNEDTLTRLDLLLEKLRPNDVTLRHAWLFNEYFPDLPTRRSSQGMQQQELRALREEATREVWASGIDSLINFVDRVNHPGFIGISLACVETSRQSLIDVFSRTVTRSKSGRVFAAALSSEAFSRLGQIWTVDLIDVSRSQSWSSEMLATAFVGYPALISHLEFVASLGRSVDQAFWSMHTGNFHSDEADAVSYAIEKMVEYGRAYDALVLLEEVMDRFASSRIIEILRIALEQLNEGEKPRLTASLPHWIGKILESLRQRSDVNREDLALTEYLCLPMLTRTGDKQSLTLHEFLATDPEFFILVLRDLYKPTNREREEDGRSPAERSSRAHVAWELLNSWDKVPGLSADGELSQSELSGWIHRARELAAVHDRTAIADQHIGHILYHVPPDISDHCWPHRAVRILIESLNNQDLETGIRVEQFNSRGTTSRDRFEGGEQERLLAKQWRKWASGVGPEWPRTQALLFRIADEWDSVANHEDEEARKDELRNR